VDINGDAYCWGSNSLGQLGSETEFDIQPVPVIVPGLDSVSRINASGAVTFAITADGAAYGWGKLYALPASVNPSDIIHDGATEYTYTPTLLRDPIAP
jgi:alpha-tubulin suppressor-like RCC1 family protein